MSFLRIDNLLNIPPSRVSGMSRSALSATVENRT